MIEKAKLLDLRSSMISVIQGQISSNLADEAVILNLESGIYYGLNEVGARVWQLLQTPQSFSAIKERLLAEYEVDTETCEQDLVAILQDLQDAKLIEIAHEAVA